MSRRLVNITLDNLSDLPTRCRNCVYWELDPGAAQRAADNGGAALEKAAWVADALLEWGCCGQLVYVDGVPAGYVMYAPPAYVPRSIAFPTSPVSPDAVLLMTGRIVAEFAGSGLGRMLLQGLARDVVRRGIRAVEAFGRTTDGAPTPATRGADYRCLLPAGYLRAVGFKTIRQHPLTPRMRLDVKSTATWREDVEYAIEKLLGSMQSPVLSR